MSKNNRVTVYLIKEELVLDLDLVKDDTKSVSFNEDFKVYYKESKTDKPKWLRSFFKNEKTLKNHLYNSSSRALLLRRVNVNEGDEEKVRIFAIPFGYGKYLLKDDVFEDRFGIKTVVNLIGEENIRSINKTNVSTDNKQSREQMPKESTIFDFGFNVNGDLINSLTGSLDNDEFIKGNITGSDSFQATVPYNISNIDEYLKEIYNVYIKDDYKESFAWIDYINPVNNKEINKRLDELLFKKVLEDKEDVYMANPKVIDFTIVEGFRIPGIKELKTDIELKDVKNSFMKGLNNIGQFKDKRILVISSLDEEIIDRFSAYNCFITEVDYNDKSYTISNGKWYEIEKDFVKSINKEYESINIANIDLIKSSQNITEKDYNELVVNSNKDKYYLMDAKNIMYGGGYNRIELCDILTKDNKLIHVKKYGGSSVLSHLFNQGLVSAELIKGDRDFIIEANNKITKSDFKINENNKYEIVYAIITNDDNDRPNIPFFSKVSINNVVKRLKNMEYDVSIKNIKRDKIN